MAEADTIAEKLQQAKRKGDVSNALSSQRKGCVLNMETNDGKVVKVATSSLRTRFIESFDKEVQELIKECEKRVRLCVTCAEKSYGICWSRV